MVTKANQLLFVSDVDNEQSGVHSPLQATKQNQPQSSQLQPGPFPKSSSQSSCSPPLQSRSLTAHHPVDFNSRTPVRGQLFRKAKVKSLRMTAVIVLAFICCWTPYYVVFIKFVFTHSVNANVAMWIFFCGMANSMLNPLIYGAFHCCSPKKKR